MPGIACTLKHFPGHGDTSEDTHVGTVTLNKTLDDLRSCELVPFAQNVNNAPLIMAAHITVPQVTGDDTPASLSSVMLTDLLRGELGYQGLIVTDSLAMQAITDVYTPGQAAVKALQAGADLLLMPNGLADAYTARAGSCAGWYHPPAETGRKLAAHFAMQIPIRHPDAVTRCRL